MRRSNGQHLKHIGGAGSAGDQFAIVEQADQVIEVRIKPQSLRFNQLPRIAHLGTIKQDSFLTKISAKASSQSR